MAAKVLFSGFFGQTHNFNFSLKNLFKFISPINPLFDFRLNPTEFSTKKRLWINLSLSVLNYLFQPLKKVLCNIYCVLISELEMALVISDLIFSLDANEWLHIYWYFISRRREFLIWMWIFNAHMLSFSF